MASIKVLYVDDEPDLHEIVKLFLEQSGEIQLDAVPSVKAAETALLSSRYDAIISDYQMPEINGLEFLNRLRSKNNRIPFILFTGRGREEVVIEALNSGADFYMQKSGSPLTQFAELEHYVVQGVRKYRTEIAKLESDAHIRSLVENSFEGIAVHIDAELVETNNALSEITGYTREELIGKSLKDLFTPASWNEVNEKLKLPISKPFDVQVVRKDGQTVSAQTRGKNIIWNGQLARLGTVFDISARKRTEEKLLQSEKNYRKLIETSPDIIWEVDQNGNFTYISPRITDVLGYSQQEIVGRPIFSLNSNMSGQQATEHFIKHVLNPEKFSTFELITHHKNGDQMTIEICSGPYLDDDGRLIGFRGNARDITERKRSEGSEKKTAALLSAILESSPDVIVFALDREYRYLAFNKLHRRTMKTIWGKKITLGTNMLDIIGRDEDREKARINFDQALSGKSFTITEEYGDEDLGRLTWQNYYSPIGSEDGGTAGMTCYCLNVTGLERAKYELQDANNKLRIISSITRHDMLNKLTALHGYLELEMAKVTDKKTLAHFQKMVRIANDLEDQINFTREYQEIGLLTPAWQSLEEVCRHAEEQLDHGQVNVQIGADGLEVFADPMLNKVFHNLMDNSMKHGHHVTTIQIGWESSGNGTRVVYQDDGIGIAAKDKKKLFIEGSSKHHGLGLFLAKEILKITGITIQETGEPGKGVRFEMLVPPGKYRSRNG